MPQSIIAQLPGAHDDETSTKSIVLRLYLVRHGETEANRNKIAAGQAESSLTGIGIQEASTLSTSIEHIAFDKLVVSDMERTRHTARLVVPSATFELEPRLREMAKGAREGFPKILTYEEALKMRQQSAEDLGDLPLLESNNDVWNRVSDWLLEAIREAVALRQHPSSKVYSCLAVTHAGVIRSMCAHLVPRQLPESIDTSDMGQDGATQSHLVVPTTSVTILDFSLRDSSCDLTDLLDLRSAQELLEIKLKLLTWHKHVHNLNKN